MRTMDRSTVGPVEVELRGIVRRYGATVAVREVSLTVSRGEFFTLLGPSGCGKTTLLRIVAGLLPPDAGDVLFDGRAVTHLPPWERNIGMVFQNYALWPHLTVFDNVAFGLVERRLPPREIRTRVHEALELVGLQGLAHRFPSQLSGGQQQRVALARALVMRPGLLLLDEPLSNLDAKLRAQMRSELVRLQRELGITTLYVTHDQEEALVLSTRIAVMRAGEVVQVGRPRELYEQPRDPFVADFLGGANLLAGTVVESREAVVVRLNSGEVLHSAHRPPSAAPGAAVVVAIRPEHLRLCPPDAADAPALEGTVRMVVDLGWAFHAEVALRDGTLLQVRVLEPSEILRPGERVRLLYDPHRVRIFPEGKPFSPRGS